MNTVSELALNYLQRYDCQIFEDYKTVLRTACEIHPPPHGMAWYGNLYRQFARNAEWFANSLMGNAAEEGTGSREVWEFSQGRDNQEFAKLVRNHAIDESRHNYLAVLRQLHSPQKRCARAETMRRGWWRQLEVDFELKSEIMLVGWRP